MTMSKFTKTLLAAALSAAAAISHGQILQSQNGKGFMPDEWLLGDGQQWHHRVAPRGVGKNLGIRKPTVKELGIIQKIDDQFGVLPAKAVLLGDGDQIVWANFKHPATPNSIYLSASVDKTVTAMSAGVAICSGKITLNTKVKDVLPELDNTAIGESTLRHNLMMASGTTKAFDDTQSYTKEESNNVIAGNVSLMDLMKRRWGKQQGWNKPGQKFDYKSQDPYIVGMMISAAYGGGGKNFRAWQQEHFFPLVGTADRIVQSQDKFGYAQAAGSTRLSIIDWARFAVFVNQARKDTGCYGDYVREATKTQIATDKRFAKSYDGYGYFTWTENRDIPNSFSALGYGGQAIVWSTINQKYFLIFSNNLNPAEIHSMAKLWLE